MNDFLPALKEFRKGELRKEFWLNVAVVVSCFVAFLLVMAGIAHLTGFTNTLN